MNYPNVQLFIDGKWRPAASGRTIPVINPATEENIGTVPHADRSDLEVYPRDVGPPGGSEG